MGMRRLGDRLVLPASLLVRRILSRVLLPPHDVRNGCLVQPMDRKLWAKRGCLWSLWRRWLCGGLQPSHWNLRTWLFSMGALRFAKLRRRLQSENGNVRTYESRIECVRQLGLEFGAPRRRLGANRPRDPVRPG